MPSRVETGSDNDDSDIDPGREVIERNARARLQRFANHTKEELNKVLKRVDHVGRAIFLFFKWKSLIFDIRH